MPKEDWTCFGGFLRGPNLLCVWIGEFVGEEGKLGWAEVFFGGRLFECGTSMIFEGEEKSMGALIGERDKVFFFVMKWSLPRSDKSLTDDCSTGCS